MKKSVFAVLAVLGVAVLALGAASLASAQEPDPVYPGGGFGRGGRGPGMGMGGYAGEASPLHDYMVDSLASALGIALEQFEARRDAGETFYQIALNLGFEADEIRELMLEARSEALAQALADGAISQDQADWMLDRLEQMQANGFGSGACLEDGAPLGSGPHGPRGNR